MTRYESLRKMAADAGFKVSDFDLGDGRTKGYVIHGGPEGTNASVMLNDRNEIRIHASGNERIFMTDYVKMIKRARNAGA